MVKDLLMLYPRGPEMRQTKSEYTVRQTWSGKAAFLTDVDYGGDSPTQYPQARNWGYTNEQFYALLQGMGHQSASVSEWHYQGMLMKHTTPGYCDSWSNSKWTRTCRRLNNRISHAYTLACKSGKLGDLMFRVDITTHNVPSPAGVRWHWDRGSSVEVTVPAATAEEAVMLVDSCFGHAISRRGQAHGWEQGGDAEAMVHNQEAVAQLSKERKRWENIISAANQQIDRIVLLQEAIETYTMSAFTGEEDN